MSDRCDNHSYNDSRCDNHIYNVLSDYTTVSEYLKAVQYWSCNGYLTDVAIDNAKFVREYPLSAYECSGHHTAACEKNKSSSIESWTAVNNKGCNGHSNKCDSNTTNIPSDFNSGATILANEINNLVAYANDAIARKKQHTAFSASSVDERVQAGDIIRTDILTSIETQLQNISNADKIHAYKTDDGTRISDNDDSNFTFDSPSSGSTINASTYNEAKNVITNALHDCVCYSDCGNYSVCYCYGNCNHY